MGLLKNIYDSIENLKSDEKKEEADAEQLKEERSEAEEKNKWIFPNWPDSVHAQTAQRIRIRMASALSIEQYSAKTGTAKIRERDGTVCSTTLRNCSCDDFQRRHMPCRHMYRLAVFLNRMDYSLSDHPAADADRYTDGMPTGDSMAFRQYAARCCLVTKDGKKHPFAKEVVAFGENPAQAFSGRLAKNVEIIPGTVHAVPYARPSRAELAYARDRLNLAIPVQCCREDLACMINRAENPGEPAADPVLRDFCKEHRINFSMYASEKRLASLAYHDLWTTENRTAFVIASRMHDLWGNWNFENWDSMKELAKELLQNETFRKEMEHNYTPSPDKNTYLYREITKLVESL